MILNNNYCFAFFVRYSIDPRYVSSFETELKLRTQFPALNYINACIPCLLTTEPSLIQSGELFNAY